MNPFLAGLVVSGRRCLVIGGDREACDKSRRLLAAGAHVTVVSPELAPAFAALITAENIPWRAREFVPDEDLAVTPFLVMSAVRDEALSTLLFERADRDRFLLCCIDQPAWSNFANPAVAHLGPVSLGLASGGAVPGLLRRLRDDLAAGLGGEFPEFARYVTAVRASAAPEQRRALVAQAIAGFRVELTVHLPEAWRERWRAIARALPEDSMPLRH